MGEPLQTDGPQAEGGDTEEVDAVVVTPTPRALPVRRAARAVVPAVQAAAVAAGASSRGGPGGPGAPPPAPPRAGAGGAARRLGRRTGGGRGRGRANAAWAELVKIVGSRSLLVDVHLLGGRD